MNAIANEFYLRQFTSGKSGQASALVNFAIFQLMGDYQNEK